MDILKRQFPIKSLIFLKSNCHAKMAPDKLGLHRIFAQCRAENLASRRVMVKLGMREEGVLRDNVFARDEWWSSAQSSILSDEWTATRKAH